MKIICASDGLIGFQGLWKWCETCFDIFTKNSFAATCAVEHSTQMFFNAIALINRNVVYNRKCSAPWMGIHLSHFGIFNMKVNERRCGSLSTSWKIPFFPSNPLLKQILWIWFGGFFFRFGSLWWNGLPHLHNLILLWKPFFLPRFHSHRQSKWHFISFSVSLFSKRQNNNARTAEIPLLKLMK